MAFCDGESLPQKSFVVVSKIIFCIVETHRGSLLIGKLYAEISCIKSPPKAYCHTVFLLCPNRLFSLLVMIVAIEEGSACSVALKFKLNLGRFQPTHNKVRITPLLENEQLEKCSIPDVPSRSFFKKLKMTGHSYSRVENPRRPYSSMVASSLRNVSSRELTLYVYQLYY